MKQNYKPSHYHKNEIDVHGYLQKHFPKEPTYTVAEGFHIGNVIKYVSRYKQKNGLSDLKKAMDNLLVLMEMQEKKEIPVIKPSYSDIDDEF